MPEDLFYALDAISRKRWDWLSPWFIETTTVIKRKRVNSSTSEFGNVRYLYAIHRRSRGQKTGYLCKLRKKLVQKSSFSERNLEHQQCQSSTGLRRRACFVAHSTSFLSGLSVCVRNGLRYYKNGLYPQQTRLCKYGPNVFHFALRVKNSWSTRHAHAVAEGFSSFAAVGWSNAEHFAHTLNFEIPSNILAFVSAKLLPSFHYSSISNDSELVLAQTEGKLTKPLNTKISMYVQHVASKDDLTDRMGGRSKLSSNTFGKWFDQQLLTTNKPKDWLGLNSLYSLAQAGKFRLSTPASNPGSGALIGTKFALAPYGGSLPQSINFFVSR